MKKLHALIAFIMLCCLGAGPAAGFDGTDFKGIKTLAEQGNAEAQMKLGVMYSSGLGVPMDKKEGVKWYQKSAEQGHPGGQWNLAFAYVKGEALPVDYAKAFELFKKAAELGHDNAQYDLGMMYLQGLGTAVDRAEAAKWFNISAALGNRGAKKMLKELADESDKDKSAK